MSDNVSLIDAIKLVAKAIREDATKVSDMASRADRRYEAHAVLAAGCWTQLAKGR